MLDSIACGENSTSGDHFAGGGTGCDGIVMFR
jgi:hypothetical protein